MNFAVTLPGELVSINEVTGKGWPSVYRVKEAWRNAGYYHGLEMRRTLRQNRVHTPMERAVVSFDFDVRQNRRRDGHNYTGTVVKWFIDGMVIAKVFVDDSSEHLEVRDPTFSVRPQGQGEMRVTIE